MRRTASQGNDCSSTTHGVLQGEKYVQLEESFGKRAMLYAPKGLTDPYMRVVLKVLVFGLYLGDHFSYFKGLAKVSRKKTRKDYTFSRKMCDSRVVQ